MIEQFKELEARSSGVIFKSTLDQIKKLYEAGADIHLTNNENKTALDLAYDLREKVEASWDRTKNPSTVPPGFMNRHNSALGIVNFLEKHYF